MTPFPESEEKVTNKSSKSVIAEFIGMSQLKRRKFYKNYIKRLKYQNRFFNVKGITVQNLLSLELQKVFVELDITLYQHKKKQTAETRERLDYDPKPLHTTTIWNLLDLGGPEYRILAIIGKPGAGKTTLLQHVTLMLAAGKAPGTSRSLIPLHLPLRKFNQDIALSENEAPNLSQIFAKELQSLEPPEGWFDKLLVEYGYKCVVMLDGLDEVADQNERKKVVEWVHAQTAHYKTTRFIITSRPHGYRDNPVENATLMEIEDFSHEQIIKFIHGWYNATEVAAAGQRDQGIVQLAEDNANDLTRRIFKSEVISKLALNPLLLTMVTMVHRFVGKLPEMRAALYEDIFKVLLGRRQETYVGNTKLNVFQKRAILQELALGMMQDEKREIPTSQAIDLMRSALQKVGILEEDNDRFIETIINESGLLIEPDTGKIAFAHLTYQEYMAAIEVKNFQQEALLRGKIGDSWWHETILLYCAISDATEIVKACLYSKERTLGKLKLAYEIFQEAMLIAPKEREKLEKEIVLEAESDNEERQQLAADLLFELRLKKMIRIDNDLEVDPFFISQLEYQSFINEGGPKPDHWKGLRFDSGMGLTPVLGIRRGDANDYAKWLTLKAHRLGHRNSSFRIPTAAEISQIDVQPDITDPNFKNLVNKHYASWISDADKKVYPDAVQTLASIFFYQNQGEKEIERISGYHKTINDLMDELYQTTTYVNRQVNSTLNDFNKSNIDSALRTLPDKVIEFVNQIDSIKKGMYHLEEQVSQRGFSLMINVSKVKQLDSEIVDIRRLPFVRSGDEAKYQVTDKAKIIERLVKTKRELLWFESLLTSPLRQAQAYQTDLYKLLKSILKKVAENAIDLSETLEAVLRIRIPKFGFNEIELVRRRSIAKDFIKARIELLTIAEYYLYQTRIDLAEIAIRAFWAVFFVEQRSKKENSLPAWEGLRLVREIRLLDERGA